VDIRATPLVTVQHEATYADAGKLSELLAQVGAMSSVRKAESDFNAAKEKVARLEQSRDGLNERGRELVEQLRTASDALRDALIEHYAGAEIDAAGLAHRQLLAESEYRAVNRALAHVVEHLAPGAFIELLLAEASHCAIRAQELDALANQRAEETTKLLSAAAEFEGGAISFDARSTLSGRLTVEADRLRDRAVSARSQAVTSERAWAEIRRSAESRSAK